MTPFAVRCATIFSGSYMSLPAAASKLLVDVRFFCPLPCAFSGVGGGGLLFLGIGGQ